MQFVYIPLYENLTMARSSEKRNVNSIHDSAKYYDYIDKEWQ